MTRSRWFVALVLVVLAAGSAPAQAPKTPAYPFAVPPLELYDRLLKLGVGTADPLPRADREILAGVWAARSASPAKAILQADDAAVAAHLIACGVGDPAARAKYLKKFEELVAAAKGATAGAKTDREKADALLRFLHKGVMANGYAAEQTTLSGVFDAGKFNCVSSSALYFLVGTRLGLKLQPVVIPGFPVGHTAVDLLDGAERVEIEPTNPDGYDWPTKINQPGVVALGPKQDRSTGYDTDGFGLAASAASNLGTAAGNAADPRPAEAVRFQAVALALAPTDPGVANNMVAAVSNWGLKMNEAKKYEEALTLYAFGRETLGPKDSVEHNHYVVWEHYLDDVFEAGKFADGLKLVARAAAAFPKAEGFADPAEWVRRAGAARAKKDGWPAGLAYADDALKHLAGDAAKRVHAWKAGTRRLWSQDHLGNGNPDGSLKVLADGLTEYPGNADLIEGVLFHTQEALALLDKKSGPAAAIAHFKVLCETFPKTAEVRTAGFSHAAGAVDRLCDDKKFEDALKAAGTYAPLAGDRVAELKALAFDAWGRSLAADGKWEASLAKYVEGLAACPKDERLRNNVVVVIDDWAGKAIDKKAWDEAIRIYDVGLKHFPDSSHLKDNRAYCVSQKK